MKETGPLSLLRAKGRIFPLSIKCLYVTDSVLWGMKNEKHMSNRQNPGEDVQSGSNGPPALEPVPPEKHVEY